MAPYGGMTAGFNVLAKSFSVFCTNTLARSTGVLPAPYLVALKNFTSSAQNPPKKPMNGYLIFVSQQRPLLMKQHPDIKQPALISKLAKQWRTMTIEEKKPFEDAAQNAKEQFIVDFQQYQAQLTPAQSAQINLERKEIIARRIANRKKRELTSFGKPKRARSPFNIFMAENFNEATGATVLVKMKTLVEEWKNIHVDQKQVYLQLAEDDTIRYKNEIKTWEDHMLEIGREDLIRGKSLGARKRIAAIEAKVAKVTGASQQSRKKVA